MTVDLEDRLRTFYRDRTAHLPTVGPNVVDVPVRLPPTSGHVVALPVAAAPRRPRRAAIASAIVVAVAGAAAAVVVVVVRHGANDTTAASVPNPATSSLLDRLLYPVDASDDSTVQVTVGPDLGDGASGLVRSPDGALFQVSVNASNGAEMTPNVQTQVHNNRTYTVEEGSDTLFYRSLDACAEVGILQSDPSETAWDADISTVLDSLHVVGQNATLTLPDGWESYGTGVASTPIQLSFSAHTGAVARRVSLMQIADSPVSTVMAPGDEPLVETTFDGHIAWTRDGATRRSLFWQNGSTAVSLSSTDATLAELEQIASELEHGHASDLAGHIQSSDPQPPGTLPPDASRPAADCGSPQLSIRTS